MRAPRLNRQMVLEDPLQIADGAGGFRHSWQALGTIWAEVSLRSGRQSKGLSQTRLKITLRAAPVGSSMRPRPEQRLREGARIYLIDAVHERDSDGRYLICYAHEEVAA